MKKARASCSSRVALSLSLSHILSYFHGDRYFWGGYFLPSSVSWLVYSAVVIIYYVDDERDIVAGLVELNIVEFHQVLISFGTMLTYTTNTATNACGANVH